MQAEFEGTVDVDDVFSARAHDVRARARDAMTYGVTYQDGLG